MEEPGSLREAASSTIHVPHTVIISFYLWINLSEMSIPVPQFFIVTSNMSILIM